MADVSFYRRPLPSSLVALSSDEGRRLFKEALAEGGMEGYFPLAEQMHTQAEPSFCGLGSLVVVLNALAIDPGRLWKGPWRWFGEELLDCCSPLDEVRKEGITLNRLACLARCNGARVKTFPAGETTVAELRYHVRAASSASAGVHVIAAYSRAALGQTGDGHYSPIGGYHRGSDSALILDVARFKYPPHWVPLDLLWESMQRRDASTGKPRGFFVMTRGEGAPALCHAPCEAGEGRGAKEDFRAAWRAFLGALSGASAEAGGAPVEEAFRALRARLTGDAARVVVGLPSNGAAEGMEGGARDVAGLVEEIRALALFESARRAGFGALGGPPGDEMAAELLVIKLLACPPDVRAAMPRSLSESVAALSAPGGLPPKLAAEVARVRAQLEVINQTCCGGVEP